MPIIFKKKGPPMILSDNMYIKTIIDMKTININNDKITPPKEGRKLSIKESTDLCRNLRKDSMFF
jgi:hypothetical protein